MSEEQSVKIINYSEYFYRSPLKGTFIIFTSGLGIFYLVTTIFSFFGLLDENNSVEKMAWVMALFYAGMNVFSAIRFEKEN